MDNMNEYDWKYIASSEEAHRLSGLSDREFLDYIIANGAGCDYVVEGFKA